MRKMQLHIFDFDGTIFFSPAPPSRMKQHHHHEQSEHKYSNSRYDSRVYGQLYSPLSSGGLGWFQSLSSLSPPHVPESPSIDKWFEHNVLKRIRLLTSLVHKVHANEDNRQETTAIKERKEQMMNTTTTVEEPATEAKHVIDVDALSSSSSSSSSLSSLSHRQEPAKPLISSQLPHSEPTPQLEIKLFILTGRDEKYRARIEHLLSHAGILPSITKVFLKPFETAGTVRYKLDTFMHLIEQYKPSHVYYYEDRLEQGGKLLLGVRAIQERLCRVTQEHQQHEKEQQYQEKGEHHSSEPFVLCELKEMHDSCAETSKHKEGKVEHYKKDSKEVDDKEHITEQLPMTEKNRGEATQEDETNRQKEEKEHEDITAKKSKARAEDAIHEYSTECRHDRILASLEDGESAFKQKCMELCFDYDPTAMQRAERQVHQWLQNYINTSQRATDKNATNYDNKMRQTTLFNTEATTKQVDCVNLHPFHFSMILVPISAREQSANMLNDEQVDALVSSLHAERDEYVSQKYEQNGRSATHYTHRHYNRHNNYRR